MSQLGRMAPLAAGIWRRAPQWLRGAVTWMIAGKVIVGVSGVLLNEEGQVLLLRHRFHNNRIWGLPGGWLSPGETVYECWRREVKEELALGDVSGSGCMPPGDTTCAGVLSAGANQRGGVGHRSRGDPRGPVLWRRRTASHGTIWQAGCSAGSSAR